MIRWTLIVVSLVLALAAGTVWTMTAHGPYGWEWPSNRRMTSEMVWSVTVRDGGIQVNRGLAFVGSGPGWPVERSEVAGFQYARVFVIVPHIEQTLVQSWRVPLWAPVLLFSAYPVAALLGNRTRLRRRRRVRGLCEECGYNLTGNESGICPECGTPITPAK